MTSVLACPPETSTALPLTRVRDYLELTKPRIGVMVVVTVALAGFVATWGQPEPGPMLGAMLGTALVAASSSVMNQILERETDARMPRTRHRPLPAGRITAGEALLFSLVLFTIGLGFLWRLTTPLATGLAGLTWLFYVVIYTPMKRRTAWNTALGAIPGAMPVLIGWSAVQPVFGLRAVALFLLLFLWQFPHFMAIAWKYRRDYAMAGMRMSTVVDPSGERAGVQAVLGAVAMLPVSMVFVLLGPPSICYLLGAFALGLCYLAGAVAFACRRTDDSARSLVRLSLIHLPLLLILVCGIPWMP